MVDCRFEEERRGQRIVGIDEVGRGPLAGPVVCAGVLIPDLSLPFVQDIRDSKRLSAMKRETLSALITQHCETVIVEIGVNVIDELNILQATFKGMEACAAQLQGDHYLIDGNMVPPNLSAQATPIAHGDDMSVSIACASIIAKVHRDRLMGELSHDYPDYDWASNKGYGTARHLKALTLCGATPHHRRSFAPVARAIEARTQSIA